jgi:hypothetical protein
MNPGVNFAPILFVERAAISLRAFGFETPSTLRDVQTLGLAAAERLACRSASKFEPALPFRRARCYVHSQLRQPRAFVGSNR